MSDPAIDLSSDEDEVMTNGGNASELSGGRRQEQSIRQNNDFSSALQPPMSVCGPGKPLSIKRRPGRPRKDGGSAVKCSKPILKVKRFASGRFLATNCRGIRGRRKRESVLISFRNNFGSGNPIDLGQLGNESPSRADDTAESDSSSAASSLEKLYEDTFVLFPEQWPGKVCAFCNLGERSMLGQGDMLRLKIPLGFDPLAVQKVLLASISKTEKDNLNDRSIKTAASIRRLKGIGKMKRLTSQSSLESINEPVDEVIGFPDEPDINILFDTAAGFYFVHSSCARWCRNVTETAEGVFENLELEILRASNQRCNHCGNFGAGLLCKGKSCEVILHFPCTAASGTYQERSTYSTYCTAHMDIVESNIDMLANCTVCNSAGNYFSMLMCCSCGHHYHSVCMALNPDPSIRAGWQCPACKICQACRQPGEENKLLSCDTCDKAYHIFCLRPALLSIPKHSWKCKMCRVCSDCGARTPGSGPSSRWHANFSICDSCYQQRNKGLACPLCGKAYRHVAQKLMLQCHMCKKFVHGTCDPNAELSVYQQKKEMCPEYDYTCLNCNTTSTNPFGPLSRGLSSLRKSSDMSEIETNSLMSILSQDSSGQLEDDILLSVDGNHDPYSLNKKRQNFSEGISPSAFFAGKAIKKKNCVGRPRNIDLLSGNSRRSCFSDIGRKRGPKPKMRGVFGMAGLGLQRPNCESPLRGEEEPGVENRLVLCSSKDDFVLQQDVCVMCGAFGNDSEGRLISCAQCGQCYHPFCVNVTVTKVVLQKGWRCLDCTVCEGCGQRHDESRLILCDDCDISFHIYCINPPLDYVPQGNWKCKWCTVCQVCGSNEPGLNSVWQHNYNLCGPCTSLSNCAMCNVEYTETDLIIQCLECDRWLHTTCDEITNEEDAEKCAENEYKCASCRPQDVLPPHLVPSPPPIQNCAESPPRSPESLKFRTTSQFLVDGVCLSDSGMHHIKSLLIEQPRKKRKKTNNIADMEAGILAAIETVVSGSSLELMPDMTVNERLADLAEKDREGKKRQRNLQKLGIGGFLVRLRGSRFKDDEFDPIMETQGVIGETERPKKKSPRRKIKNKLVESFPLYLQDAFFGKILVEPFKENDVASGDDFDADTVTAEEMDVLDAVKTEPIHLDNDDKNLIKEISQFSTDNNISDGFDRKNIKIKIEEGCDHKDYEALSLPGDALNNIPDTCINRNGDGKGAGELLPASVQDSGETTRPNQHSSTRRNRKSELTDFLSSEFTLDSIGTGLPSMDSKDVEDIFKVAHNEESQELQETTFPNKEKQSPTQMFSYAPSSLSTSPIILIPPSANQPVVSTPVLQGSPGVPRGVPLQQNVQQGLTSPINFPPPSPYHSEYSNSPQFSPAFSEPPSPWPSQVEHDVDPPSTYNQRSLLKWEADEVLGNNATISAVLYANMNHPELKREYLSWNERSKQIAKIWRSLSAEKRAPYLQKARENRAASRMQKVQQMPKEGKGCSPNKKGIPQKPSPDNEPPKQVTPSPSSCGMTLHNPDVPTALIEPKIEKIDNFVTPDYNNSPNPSFSATSSYCPAVSVSPRHSSFVTQINPSLYQSPVHQSKTLSLSNSMCQTDTFQSTKLQEPQNNKCTAADQQIRVLTPSEIMRTLPTLTQENYGFPTAMDQDKLLTNGPTKSITRAETPEERHWKQMQAYRQQQAQQQQLMLQEHRVHVDPKQEHVGAPSPVNTGLPSPKHQYTPVQVQRQLSVDSNPGGTISDSPKQTHQVAVSLDQNMANSKSRQIFSVGVPSNRMPQPLEMPPPIPSPHYSVRPNQPPPQSQLATRPALYSRIPFVSSARPQINSPTSAYPAGTPPEQFCHSVISRPQSDTSPYSPNSETFHLKPMTDPFLQTGTALIDDDPSLLSGSPRGSGKHCNETRQHLRELLQRQQNKKMMELEPILNSDTAIRKSAHWPRDDWQNHVIGESSSTENYIQKPQGGLPASPQSPQQNQFRFLSPQLRMSHPNPNAQQQHTQSSVPTPPGLTSQSMDPPLRLFFQQNQQRIAMSQHVRPPGLAPSQQEVQSNQQGRPNVPTGNALDPYDRRGQPQPVPEMTSTDNSGPSSMLAQQLVRPTPVNPNPNSRAGQNLLPKVSRGQGGAVSTAARTVTTTSGTLGPADHQELPDSVTAELEKLEQEQHNDNETCTEPETADLVDLGVDDDELLGMGADFNILEYADPELDQAVGGEKTNILDNLDLEEEKEDEKEENKHIKGKIEKEKHGKERSGTDDSTSSPLEERNLKEINKKNVEMSVPSSPKEGFSQTGPKDSTVTILQNTQPPPGEGSGPFQSQQYGAPLSQSYGASAPAPSHGGQPPPYPGLPPPYPGRIQLTGNRGGGDVKSGLPPASTGLQLKKPPRMDGAELQPIVALSGTPVSVIPSSNLSVHQRRTLLLQEQPLLLEELLEQEKREQQKQGPNFSVSNNSTVEEPLLSDFDFDKIKADVLQSEASPQSNVKGILRPPHSQSTVFNRGPTGQLHHEHGTSEWPPDCEIGPGTSSKTAEPMQTESPGPKHPLFVPASTASFEGATRYRNSVSFLPPPPNPPEFPATEQERQMQVQYEQWLYHQQHILTLQLKYFDTEVTLLRKGKKSIKSKQRQLRKNCNELNEQDTAELEKVTRELTGLQKQLEHSRKQARQHGVLIQEYRAKQQNRQQMLGNPSGGLPSNQVPLPSQVSPSGTASLSPIRSTSQSPMLSPSPSMSTHSSPHTQNSPMASPLTPSPGPVHNCLPQGSPRSSVNPSLHQVRGLHQWPANKFQSYEISKSNH